MFSKIKLNLQLLYYKIVGVPVNYRKIYEEAVNKYNTVYGLLVISDQQRDQLLEQIQNYETIVENYVKQVRNLKKELRGKE